MQANFLLSSRRTVGATCCKYNKSILLKEVYDHNVHLHLPECIMLQIKPIFQALSNPELLKKCLKGKTQNPNESLNNVIWTRIPKRTFVSLETLHFGVNEAILSYNDGYVTKLKVIEKLGLQAGRHLVNAMRLFDDVRIRKAEKAELDLEKKIRQARCLAKRRLEDVDNEQEDPDNPSYSAGHY